MHRTLMQGAMHCSALDGAHPSTNQDRVYAGRTVSTRERLAQVEADIPSVLPSDGARESIALLGTRCRLPSCPLHGPI